MTTPDLPVKTRKKLIEVALPLDAINAASAREKSIRHGHPSTLHLWWARRPLATARAVIFAQMVDDPSSYVDELLDDADMRQAAERLLNARLAEHSAKRRLAGAADIAEPQPTLEAVAAEVERDRLFTIIENLVLWTNTTNETVLEAARAEIRASWRRTCADNADHPRSDELFDPNHLPAFHDPFAGGGALPLEAQRLGLESYASDLNPVAVLINKAMIEFPPKFASQPPVNPVARKDRNLFAREWTGAQGLAEDVRYYGQWIRDEAEKRIGQLYPKITVTPEMVKDRPDLEPYSGRHLTVIAWLWARTVKSPNPAFANVDVPLASTFMLSTKLGKEAYVAPIIEDGGYRFAVKAGKPQDGAAAKSGTKLSRGANFRCLMSGTPIEGDYIKSEGRAGRMGARLMAVVAEGDRGRVYLSPTPLHETAALEAEPDWSPEDALPDDPRNFWTVHYGLTTYGDLFTSRQLVALTTFSDLVQEARNEIQRDSVNAGHPDDKKRLRDGGTGAIAYGEAVGIYLAFAVDKCSDYWSEICTWHSSGEKMRNTFGRQAIPMTWDFAEANPLSRSSGNWTAMVNWTWKALSTVPASAGGLAYQEGAQSQSRTSGKLVSTDPPYYDNIGYADLSDFFYLWLRRSQRSVYPELFATLTVPKGEELVATPYRHGSKQKAETFFLDGMREAMQRISGEASQAFPVTIYYAFKQTESDSIDGTASTGWDTFLAAVIEAGFSIGGTWPMRTELGNRMIGSGTNALASSIVLVCRKRIASAPSATRREFVAALRTEFPRALANLQRGNIAPVDLAQASIGPGMAIYTRYAQVLDAAGKPLTVREALALINQTLDEALAEQEGDFDADSRWALAWFEQSGFTEGEFGVADVLARAKNTSVAGLVAAGILTSKAGRVKLLRPEELPDSWEPAKDERLTAWDMVHHLIRVLESEGENAAADLLAQLGAKAEAARELCYRLYTLCERKQRAAEALSYNGLVQSWPEIARLANQRARSTVSTATPLFGED